MRGGECLERLWTASHRSCGGLAGIALIALGAAVTGCDGGGAPVDIDFDVTPNVDLPSISGGHRALLPGETAQLTFSGRAPFKWYTDQPAIASVSQSGLVTAVGIGRASIFATLDPPYRYSDFTFISVYTARCSASLAVGTLAVGDTGRGTLAPSDCGLVLNATGTDHGTAIGWRVLLDSARTVRIDLVHGWYCSELFLTDTLMTLVARGPGDCDGKDRSWTIPLDPGAYLVWGRSRDVPAEGPVALTARVMMP